jgi:hypothetical protein
MGKTARLIVWILIIVMSLGSAAYGVFWFTQGRVKHGILFLPVIPIGLVIIGAAFARPKKPSPDSGTPPQG